MKLIAKGLFILFLFMVNVGCASMNFKRSARIWGAALRQNSQQQQAYAQPSGNAQLRYIQSQQPVSSHCTRAFGGGVDCVSKNSGVDTSMYQ